MIPFFSAKVLMIGVTELDTTNDAPSKSKRSRAVSCKLTINSYPDFRLNILGVFPEDSCSLRLPSDSALASILLVF